MLILTEKPSVAKDFGMTLNCRKVSGYYENPDKTIIIINCIGHLFSLYSPQEYDDKFKDWKVVPVIPNKYLYKIAPNVESQAKLVLSILKKHKNDQIIIATDADREGEIIARECLNEAGIRDTSKIKRFWVSEALTKDVIKAGLKAVLPLSHYDLLAKQGFYRQYADWLVGMNFTRYITTAADKLLPVGRVQTAILAAIFYRCKEIKDFKSQNYFEYSCSFNQQGISKNIDGIYFEDKNTTRFSNKELEDTLNKLKGQKATLINKTTEKLVSSAPLLYNLNALQKEAFRVYRYSAEKTLKIVQSLYEEFKCVSYPRTPSRVMGERNVALCKDIYLDLIKSYPIYKETEEYVDISLNNKRCFNDKKLEAHHALIPLKALDMTNTKEEHKNIYNLILERFMMAFLPDEVENKTVCILSVKDYKFKITGREVLNYGWKNKNYKWFTVNNNTEVQDITKYSFDNLYLKEVKALEKWTKAPKYFNEASILSFMENPKNLEKDDNKKLVGLGTPATRHSFIPKLLKSGYIIEEKSKIICTELGANLLNTIFSSSIKDVANIDQTTLWEEKLDTNPEVFYKDIVCYIENSVQSKIKVNGSFSDNQLLCPICHKEIKKGKNNWYCTGYKDGCKFPTIWESIAGAKLTSSDIKRLLAGKKSTIKHCKSKKGSKFDCHFILDEKYQVKMVFSQKL